ncbi:MAG TPA: nucleoside recognition domain-containing protein [Limnochordales bacterium]
MVNIIWAAMILAGIAFAALNGDIGLVTTTIFAQAAQGLTVALNLLALLTVWFGLSRIAEQAGLLDGLARLLAPLLRPLFPDLPRGHPSLSAIAMNIAANVLGLANAATPFGLKAMQEMQALNPHPDTVTPAMITFLVLNSACATLLPATAVALRAQAGAAEPALIIGPAALASGAAMVFVLLVDIYLRRRTRG